MAFTVLSLWVFRVPPACRLLTHFDTGAAGVFWATALSNVATAVVAFAWFTRGTWKERVAQSGGSGPEPTPAPGIDDSEATGAGGEATDD